MKGILHKVNGSWMVKDLTGKAPYPLFPLHPYQHQHDGLDDGSEVEYGVTIFYETGTEYYPVATLSTPFVSNNFQIGPEGAYEHNEEAVEKLRSRNYLDDNVELDEFHHHEVLDRLTIVHEMIENLLIDHPVCEEYKVIKDLVEKAQEHLADAYMEMGSIIAARDINI